MAKNPARMYRKIMQYAYTRREYMGGVPGNRILQYESGQANGDFPITLTLIPEEFADGHVPLSTVVDTLVCSIVKRLASGRPDGVAIIAEGLVERMAEHDLEQLTGVERDAHGHVRIAEIAIGDILKERVQKRLAEFGLKTTIVAKNIGYELRCADPIPYDMEYSRDLGYCAAKYLVEGGSAVFYVSNDRSGLMTLSNSVFVRNPATRFGTAGLPGFFVLAAPGQPVVTNTTISH